MNSSQFLPAGTDRLISGVVPQGWTNPVQKAVGGIQQVMTPALLGGLAFKTNIGAFTSILSGNINLGALASLGAGAVSSLGGLTNFNPSQLGQMIPGASAITSVTSSALGMASQFGGNIGNIGLGNMLNASTALNGLTSLSNMNIGVTPLLSSMGQMTNIGNGLLTGMNAMGGLDKVLGGSAPAFSNALNSFNSISNITGGSLNSALLGRPQLLDGNTSNVLNMAGQIGNITSIMKQNSGAFYGSSQGTQLINQIGTITNIAGSIAKFGQSAAGLATGNYTNPAGLVNSLAGALSGSGSPLAGSGSLLGGIGGLAQSAAAPSAEAIIACGYGNYEVYKKYDEKPSAMSDPAFWSGRRPNQDSSKKGIYNMGDYMGSQEAQMEVEFRNKRQNYNTMVSRGMLDSSVDPQQVSSYLNVGQFNLADAFSLKAGGQAGFAKTNAYGMNLGSIFASAFPQVSKILNAVVAGANLVNSLLGNSRGFPGVNSLMGGATGGASSLLYTVGNLLHTPHLLNSQAYNYLKQPDTNYLARGTNFYEKTPANFYDSTRSLSIPKAGPQAGSWSMPESAFNSAYPHNVTRQTPSGMVEEFDGTPNSTRYHLYHPSGTRVEIDNSGVRATRVNSDDYVEVTGNGHVYVRGDYNIVIAGAANIMAKDKVQILAEGEVNAEFRNDVNFTISGSMNVIAKEAIRMKAREIQLESTDMSFKADYSLSDESKRRSTKVGEGGYDMTGETVSISSKGMNVTTEKNITIFANGNFEAGCLGDWKAGGKASASLVSSNDLNLRGTAKARLVSGSDMFLSAGGNMNYTWGGSNKVTSVYTDSHGKGYATEATPGGASASVGVVNIYADVAKNDEIKPVQSVNPKVFIDIPKIEKRANPSNIPPPTPYPKNNDLRTALHSENEGGSSSTPPPPSTGGKNPPVGSQGNSGSGAGGAGAGATPGGGTVSKDVTPTPNTNKGPIKTVDSSEFSSIKGGNEIGDRLYSMKLSQNMLVRNLSKDLGHVIEAQVGLTADQILDNLKHTAENLVEPLLAKYGANLIITSGYRNAKNVSNKASQHCKGQAIDIQRKDLNRNNRADYEKFRSEVLATVTSYDQCILENTPQGSHWVHVSFNKGGNRQSSFNISGASGHA
jgi:hypothetical protein